VRSSFRQGGDFVAFEKVLHEALRLDKIPNWVDRVNEPLTDHELKSIRNCAQRSAPFGDETWVESIARRLVLESTMRSLGRPRVRPLPKDDQYKEV
jgi:putative transposase